MSDEPQFGPEAADWMQSGTVSVTVASRSEAHRPAIGASFGCRISSDRRRVTVFLDPESRDVIDGVCAHGAIAVVITDSAIARSIQLKGADAAVTPLGVGDRERMTAYVGALARHWALAGQQEEWTRALFAFGDAAPVAIAFTPYVAFDQTPGPNAGTSLSRTE